VRSITAGGGGAPAVVMSTGCDTGRADGSAASMTSTVGAPFKCDTRSSSINLHTTGGSTFGRHTCVAPTAVTAQVKHQPLQWNMGSVQR